MNYQSLSTAELIATFDNVDLAPDPELIRCCLARGEEIKPWLLARIAWVSEVPSEDNKLWLDGPIIHAAQILIKLREPAALDYIEQIFRNEKYGDYLDFLMPALANYGPPAVPFLTRVINDAGTYIDGRIFAFETLSKIARCNPSERQHVIDIARALLPRLDEHGELVFADKTTSPDEIWNWAVTALGDMRDTESKALVAKLDQLNLLNKNLYGTSQNLLKPFQADAVFEPCNEQYDLLDEYELLFNFETAMVESPIDEEFDDEDDFDNDDDDDKDYEYRFEQTPIVRTSPKKIGANERCPCGSGKKYKRCCQSKDID